MDVQQITLLGNLTRDPEMRYSPNGNNYTRFTVACNQRVRQKDGSYQDLASFYSCIVFGKLAEIIEQYAKKGNKIFVQGNLVADTWTDQNGNTRINLDVNATQAVLAGSTFEDADYVPQTKNRPVKPTRAVVEYDDSDDEIPF
jgi:single-strand DNA-binding protein